MPLIPHQHATPPDLRPKISYIRTLFSRAAITTSTPSRYTITEDVFQFVLTAYGIWAFFYLMYITVCFVAWLLDKLRKYIIGPAGGAGVCYSAEKVGDSAFGMWRGDGKGGWVWEGADGSTKMWKCGTMAHGSGVGTMGPLYGDCEWRERSRTV